MGHDRADNAADGPDMIGGAVLSDRVNSFHHQAVDRVPDGFVVTARSPDSIIEAIESPNRRFYVGVQWHPEHMTSPLAPATIRRARKGSRRAVSRYYDGTYTARTVYIQYSYTYNIRR